MGPHMAQPMGPSMWLCQLAWLNGQAGQVGLSGRLSHVPDISGFRSSHGFPWAVSDWTWLDQAMDHMARPMSSGEGLNRWALTWLNPWAQACGSVDWPG
jgi:hypothetical protein